MSSAFARPTGPFLVRRKSEHRRNGVPQPEPAPKVPEIEGEQPCTVPSVFDLARKLYGINEVKAWFPHLTPEMETEAGGDVVMLGYWEDAENTAHALRDDWLWTGDMGAMDADGFLTLKDRSKDMIISGGSNIYPREIEEILLQHPSVQEVSVVGAPHQDWGEEVVAFIVPAPGDTVSEKELDALCLGNIARFKRPKRYRIVDSLPKNNYGKVLKTELRKVFQNCTA